MISDQETFAFGLKNSFGQFKILGLFNITDLIDKYGHFVFLFLEFYILFRMPIFHLVSVADTTDSWISVISLILEWSCTKNISFHNAIWQDSYLIKWKISNLRRERCIGKKNPLFQLVTFFEVGWSPALTSGTAIEEVFWAPLFNCLICIPLRKSLPHITLASGSWATSVVQENWDWPSSQFSFCMENNWGSCDTVKPLRCFPCKNEDTLPKQ